MLDSSAFKTLMILLAAAGWSLLPWMPWQDTYQGADRQVTILFQAPSMMASVMEDQVTAIAEGRLTALESVQRIESVTRFGQAEVMMTIESGVDMARAERQIRATIRTLIRQLPDQIPYPQIIIGGQQRIPSIVLNYPDADPDGQLAFQAACSQLHRTFQCVQKIKFPDQCRTDFVVNLPALDQKAQQNISDLTQILAEWGSSRRLGTTNWMWECQGGTTLENSSEPPIFPQINALCRSRFGASLPVREQQSCDQQVWRNGQRMYRAEVYLNPSEVTRRNVKGLWEEIRNLQKQVPEVHILENHLSEIRDEQLQVWAQCAIAFILLAGLIWQSMGRAQAGHLMLILLQALGCSFLAMYARGIPMTNMAMGGLTIGLGMGADHGILMLMGKGAYIQRRLGLLGSMLTTVVPVFVLMIFATEVGSKMEQLLFPMAMVVCCSVPPSLILAKTELLKETREENPFRIIDMWTRSCVPFRALIVLCLILLIGVPLPRHLPEPDPDQPNMVSGLLERLHTNEFRETIYPDLRFWLGGLTVPVLDQLQNQGLSRFQESDVIRLTGESRYESPGAYLCEIGRELEQRIRDFSANQYELTCQCEGRNQLELVLKMREIEPDIPPMAIFQELASSLDKLSGIRWSLSCMGKTWSNYSPQSDRWSLLLEGSDYDRLLEKGEEIRRHISRITGVAEVDLGELEKEQAGLRMLLAPETPEIIEGLSEWLPLVDQEISGDIHIPLKGRQDAGLSFRLQGDWSLDKILFAPQDSGKIRLADISDGLQADPAASIRRIDQLYQLPISWEYYGSVKMAERTRRQILAEVRPGMPAGFNVSIPSSSISLENPLIGMLGYLLPMVIWIWMVAAVLFESMWLPFLVILAIPLAWLAPGIMICWMGMGMNEGILAGLFLITGISVNHMLFLLLPLRSRRAISSGILSVVYREKWPSIWLSVLSTSLTFGPFIVMSEPDSFWFSLATVTISGLFSGIGLTLLLLPAFLLKRS